MAVDRREVVVEQGSEFLGARIDRLVQSVVGGSRSQVTGLFDQGCVRLNGEPTREVWRRLVAADRVELSFDNSRRYHPQPKPRPHTGFVVVHEDRDVIVVEKAAGLLTVPTDRDEPYTLIDRVHEYLVRTGRGRGAYCVHRLDRGVSGLLVFGKTERIASLIRDQFADRKPERLYVAIVAGHLESPSGTIRSYLATDRDLKRFSTDDTEIGQLAVTHYRTLEPLVDTTVVEVRLETGRRNQIRVHFSEAGHPVIGDPRYEDEIARHAHWPYERIALHARTLGLVHPITGKPLRFESHIPAEMAKFIRRERPKTDSRQSKAK